VLLGQDHLLFLVKSEARHGDRMKTRGLELAKFKKRERVAPLREMATACAAEHEAEVRPVAARRVQELEAL
jgi:hypothetical protein